MPEEHRLILLQNAVALLEVKQLKHQECLTGFHECDLTADEHADRDQFLGAFMEWKKNTTDTLEDYAYKFTNCNKMETRTEDLYKEIKMT